MRYLLSSTLGFASPKTLFLCVLFFFVAGYCGAQTNLATLKANLDAANGRLDSFCTKQKADALEAYGKALDGLMAALQQKGDLDGVMAVKQEKKRFEAEKTVDGSNSRSVDVAAAVRRYQASITRAEQEKALRRIAVLKQTIAQIENLIRQLVMKDRMEDALAAKQEMETMRLVLADEESKLPPPPVKAAKPPPDKAPKPENEAPGKRVAWGRHHYQAILGKISWHQAKEACEKMGGHLVIISSSKENAFVTELVGGREVWIGCTDEAQEGLWRWVDGSILGYAGWDPGPPEPNNAWGTENYAVSKGGLWNDVNEGDGDGYVCEWDR